MTRYLHENSRKFAGSDRRDIIGASKVGCMPDDRMDASTGAVVKVLGLTRKFGEVTAVDRVTFSINRGEIFDLLAPTVLARVR